VLAGESEIENKVFTLKNMETGEQETVSEQELLEKLGG